MIKYEYHFSLFTMILHLTLSALATSVSKQPKSEFKQILTSDHNDFKCGLTYKRTVKCSSKAKDNWYLMKFKHVVDMQIREWEQKICVNEIPDILWNSPLQIPTFVCIKIGDTFGKWDSKKPIPQ
eukprot:NODE_261_length_11439_cov_1.285538.p12 type:complete len:125 gc:universal NODE_261_length_11439_cov_1.285538:10811-11185(+)